MRPKQLPQAWITGCKPTRASVLSPALSGQLRPVSKILAQRIIPWELQAPASGLEMRAFMGCPAKNTFEMKLPIECGDREQQRVTLALSRALALLLVWMLTIHFHCLGSERPNRAPSCWLAGRCLLQIFSFKVR